MTWPATHVKKNDAFARTVCFQRKDFLPIDCKKFSLLTEHPGQRQRTEAHRRAPQHLAAIHHGRAEATAGAREVATTHGVSLSTNGCAAKSILSGSDCYNHGLEMETH